MDKVQRRNNQGTPDKLRERENLELNGDNEPQRQDRRMFNRALGYAGIALVVIMLGAYLFARWGKMPGNSVRPDKHPTSELVQPVQHDMS